MPDIGERRTFNGTLAEWDGHGWVAVSGDASMPRPGAVERFVEPIAQVPGNALSFLSQMATDPAGAGQAIIDPSVAQLDQVGPAYQEGRPLAALGHAAGAFPVIGPAIAQGVEQAQGGDVAGGLGTLTATAAPFMAGPLSRATGRTMLKGLKATPAGEPLAAMAERASTARMVDTMAPKVGPNKTRFNNMAADVAPTLARDPALGAFSREGLQAKVEARLADAEAGLDAAADSRLNARTFPTAPILQALREKRRALTSEAVQGSQFVPQSGVTRPPIGRDVVPSPNAGRVAVIDRAIQEVEQLGPVARYESLRRIRQAYDGPAKVKYSPAVTPDFLAKQGEASAAADVTGVLREKLAQFDPETAKANTTYNLYRTANDVLQATQETERARPRVGRGIVARASGAMVGAHEGGVFGAGIGAIVGQMVERASQLAPTLQIVVARRLAGIADMLRRGDQAGAQAALETTIRKFPAVKTGLKITGQLLPTAGRVSDLPRAADAGEPTGPGGQ